MKVSDLINILKELVKNNVEILDYEVTSEGCDCDAHVVSVEYDEQLQEIYLRRYS